MRSRAIIFDMDGVIFDTERLVFGIWCEMGSAYGFDTIDKVFYRIVGTNTEHTERVFRTEYGEDIPYFEFRKAARAEFEARVARDGMPVKDGVYDILEYLKHSEYRIGLASSTRFEAVSRELKMAKLFDYFDVIVTGDMVEKSKPEPDIYLAACEKLGVNPKTTYAVEDSFNGVRSAHAAGMLTIMVPDLLEPTDDIRARTRVVLKSLNEAKTYLAENE